MAKNELLAQIDDIIPQMQYNVNYYKLKVAEKQALDDVDVRYAKAGYDVAGAKLQRSLRSVAITPKSVADDTIDEQRLEKEKFRLSIEKADKDLNVAVLQKGVSEAELKGGRGKSQAAARSPPRWTPKLWSSNRTRANGSRRATLLCG